MKDRSQPRKAGGKIDVLQVEANNRNSNTSNPHWKKKAAKYCGGLLLLFIIARGIDTQIANPHLANRNTVASIYTAACHLATEGMGYLKFLNGGTTVIEVDQLQKLGCMFHLHQISKTDNRK